MEAKKTLVLGASTNPARYSNMAINKLKAHGHEVVAVGNKSGMVNGVVINDTPIKIDGIDTITLYLNPTNQVQYYDYIIQTAPKRVIFNPGTENEELETKLIEAGIKPMEACTLVLLSTGQY